MTTTVATAAMAHPHGTRHRYRYGCRCQPCHNAHQRAQRLEAQHRDMGIAPPTDNAGLVRDHIRALLDRGYSLRSIADIAQVSPSSLTAVLRGAPDRPAPTQVSSRMAEAILSVHPVALDAAAAGGVAVDPAGTTRRLQALVALGWTQRRLADELGTTAGQVAHLVGAAARVQASTAEAVRDLYARLEHQAPPEGTPREKASACRARLRARKAGWPKPAEWDEGLIDLPAAELEVELRAQAEAMDDAAARSCHTSARHGDIAPLTVAGAREYSRCRRGAEKARARARANPTNPPEGN